MTQEEREDESTMGLIGEGSEEKECLEIRDAPHHFVTRHLYEKDFYHLSVTRNTGNDACSKSSLVINVGYQSTV